MTEDLKTLGLFAALPPMIWLASVHDRLFVRWPDWMDPWIVGLSATIAILGWTIMLLKPMDVPLQGLAGAAVHPVLRLLAMVNLIVLTAFFAMMFVGMGLARM